MTDSDFDEFSDGDNKANSEDSGSTKNSGPSHHVVTVTTGGGTGVNGFLSGSPPGGGLKKIFSLFLSSISRSLWKVQSKHSMIYF